MPSIIARAREYLGWCPRAAGIQGQPVRRDAAGTETVTADDRDPAGSDPLKDTVHYRHTQFGRVQVWASIAAILIIALSVVFLGSYWIGIATAIFLGAAILLFGSLTVEVSRRDLRILFGPFGIVNRVVPLASIAASPGGRDPVVLWLGGPVDPGRAAVHHQRHSGC